MIDKGIQKFCSYFILKCKKCGERFTILKDCQDGSHLSTAEKKVAYCPFCGEKSKPELWTKIK
jgi:hydrogenase maturation factor HypF (carbamoyltransferase family)